MEEVKKFKDFKKYEKEWEEMISNMNSTFNKAFKFLYDYYGMTDRLLSKLSGLSRRTISKYYNEEEIEPHYKKVLSLCIGFNLPPRVSKKLLSTIRVDLSKSNLSQDILYELLINEYYDYTLEYWNICIKDAGFSDKFLLP